MGRSHLQRLAIRHHGFHCCCVDCALELLSLGLFADENRDRYSSSTSFVYMSRIVITSSSASFSVSCTVCPSCHRNSVVRRNGRVDVISALTTEFHTLMRIGRSRQLFTHLL